MIINDKKKFAFVHVHKTAGSSIRNFLLNHFYNEVRDQYETHATIEQLHKLDPKTKEYFTFAFVRNPWDWQVSLYHYVKQTKNHPRHHIVSKLTFSEYLDWWTSPEHVKKARHRQSDYLLKSGELAVDYIGRFENLSEDFNKILNKIGVSSNKLPHINRSKRPLSYREMYSDETQELVAKYWADDIKLFNYSY